MKDIIEIRWHGRGGQGAKTAALLFAEAALATGKYIQGFPEYGPERMGAPVQAFNRLSDKPITLHCGITNPDFVVVLDPTLIKTVDVIAGLADTGAIIVNTEKTAAEMKKELNFNGKVFAINASKIAKECFGKEIPNTPMMGALVKVTKFLDINGVLEDTTKKLQKKFLHKPEIIDGNIKSIKRAYDEISG
ncbi:MAG: pyruvate synthase [Elusimicrobia bacterium RIFOXYC2_FULL_34_12]|nr:MAG: pyruvate synthase [Elusimicrobia bacterium RIFOXYC2_FULL_34_12]OGS38018.1 MAG: pyruvate synthase [Elusimicrobia bacterium RIFOXYD2_FULL_34_30]HAM38698.1 pyruvate synthase [Elusimicrobiota bacterium]